MDTSKKIPIWLAPLIVIFGALLLAGVAWMIHLGAAALGWLCS